MPFDDESFLVTIRCGRDLSCFLISITQMQPVGGQGKRSPGMSKFLMMASGLWVFLGVFLHATSGIDLPLRLPIRRSKKSELTQPIFSYLWSCLWLHIAVDIGTCGSCPSLIQDLLVRCCSDNPCSNSMQRWLNTLDSLSNRRKKLNACDCTKMNWWGQFPFHTNEFFLKYIFHLPLLIL